MFSVYATLMFVSKFLMQVLPNIHLLAMLIIVATIEWRAKALIPIYVYVFLDGVFGGFSAWWLPYLYIWLPMWLMAMGVTGLVRRFNIRKPIATVCYMVIAFIHGMSFGTLYAPLQALMFGLGGKQTLAWIIAGLPFDAIHGVSNFIVASLTLPLASALHKFRTMKS